MGLPDIVIEFSKRAVAAIQNGTLGVVGVILKDSKNNGALILRGVDEIPTGTSAFTAANTAYLERCFMGTPSKVIVYTLPTDAETYANAFKYFASQKINYIVAPPDVTSSLATSVSTWIKGLRASTIRRPVAVLPATAGDDRAVVNFCVVNGTAQNKAMAGTTAFTEAELCSRIAGLLDRKSVV